MKTKINDLIEEIKKINEIDKEQISLLEDLLNDISDYKKIKNIIEKFYHEFFTIIIKNETIELLIKNIIQDIEIIQLYLVSDYLKKVIQENTLNHIKDLEIECHKVGFSITFNLKKKTKEEFIDLKEFILEKFKNNVFEYYEFKNIIGVEKIEEIIKFSDPDKVVDELKENIKEIEIDKKYVLDTLKEWYSLSSIVKQVVFKEKNNLFKLKTRFKHKKEYKQYFSSVEELIKESIKNNEDNIIFYKKLLMNVK